MIGPGKPPVSVATLSPKKQLAFGLLVLDRMLPSLVAFSMDTGFEDSCFLRAKEAAWAALEYQDLGHALNKDCVETAPDTEKFSHELTSYALNAALAVREIVEFTSDGCMDHITHLCALAGDSIYLYLSGLEESVASSSEEDTRIADHPMMQRERRREDEDIRFLSGLPDEFSNETISALRARASTQAPLLRLSG